MRPLAKILETRHLHNSDMKQLVRIFQPAPFPVTQIKRTVYREHIKDAIHSLPRHLRASYFSISPSILCSTHKGLNASLVNDVWAWLRHEIDGAIGKFIYPLIMSGVLTEDQEMWARQLEPVSQMWQQDFNTETSAPPGREPIRCGANWAFQTNMCPACILTRIGSDLNILLVLFAGMVGRMKHRATGTDILHGTMDFEKIRSKRLRFVRYWIKTHSHDDQLLFDAVNLGLKMKQMRHEWTLEQEHLREANHQREHLERTSQNTPSWGTSSTGCESKSSYSPVDAGHGHRMSPPSAMPTSGIGIGSAVPEKPKEHPISTKHDGKLGPLPRPSNLHCLSPMGPLGFDVTSLRKHISTMLDDQLMSQVPLHRPHSRGSGSTVRPEDSISSVDVVQIPAPFRRHCPESSEPESQAMPRILSHHCSVIGDLYTLPQCQSTHRRPVQPSITSTKTITSYNGNSGSAEGGFPHNTRQDPLDNPLYNTPQMQEQLVDKYRIMLALHTDTHADQDDACTLPPPRPTSIYAAFGRSASIENGFEGTDIEDEIGWDAGERNADAGKEMPLDTPRGRRPSDTGTAWDDLY